VPSDCLSRPRWRGRFGLRDDGVAPPHRYLADGATCPSAQSLNGHAARTLRPSRSDGLDLKEIPMDWRHRAACLQEDPELFFPIGNTGPALVQIEQAKLVCRRCEVSDTCLAWALESGQDAGVWGGLSEDERRALKRRTARARARSL